MGDRLMSVPGSPGDRSIGPCLGTPFEGWILSPSCSAIVDDPLRKRPGRLKFWPALLVSEPLLSRSEAVIDPDRDRVPFRESTRGGRRLYEIGGRSCDGARAT